MWGVRLRGKTLSAILSNYAAHEETNIDVTVARARLIRRGIIAHGKALANSCSNVINGAGLYLYVWIQHQTVHVPYIPTNRL